MRILRVQKIQLNTFFVPKLKKQKTKKIIFYNIVHFKRISVFNEYKKSNSY